jgi:hypothetical protein
MLGDLLLVWLRVLRPTEILAIQLREPEAVSAGDNAVEGRQQRMRQLVGHPAEVLD